jgi:ParB-like nuclease domain
MAKAKEKQAKTAVQQFTMQTMHRKDLHDAPYNPRDIDDAARKKLKANLKRVGLLEPLVVNQRSGNVVSGHQRLALMDAIEGKSDYELDVAVVDLDEKTEKEQCAFMNNELAQGSFDVPKLADVLKVADFSLCGFDPDVVESMIPQWNRPEEPAPQTAETCDVILVFPDRDQSDRFMELIQLSKDEKYIGGELIAELVRRGKSVDHQ